MCLYGCEPSAGGVGGCKYLAGIVVDVEDGELTGEKCRDSIPRMNEHLPRSVSGVAARSNRCVVPGGMAMRRGVAGVAADVQSCRGRCGYPEMHIGEMSPNSAYKFSNRR